MRSTNPMWESLALIRQAADRTARTQLLLAAALVVIAGVLSGLAPLALKCLVDIAAAKEHPAGDGSESGIGMALGTDALALGLAYLGALAGARVLAEWRPLPAGLAEQRVHARMTRHFCAHLIALPLASLQAHRAGDLVQTLALASSGCKLLLSHLVGTVLPVSIEMFTVLLVLLHLDQPALVATAAIAAIGYLAVGSLGSAPITQHARCVSSASRDLQSLLTERFTHAETIKCQTAEAETVRHVHSAAVRLEKSWARLNRARVRVGLGMALVFSVSTAVALLLAGRAVMEGTMSAGGLALVAVYMLQIVRPLEQLGGASRDLAQALGFVEPMLRILNEPAESSHVHAGSGPDASAAGRGHTAGPNPSDSADKACQPSMRRTNDLRLHQLSFGHKPDRLVLDCIRLHIPAGSHVALVGPSGSGKSSLARLLVRLHAPTGGCIRLGDSDIAAMRLERLRRTIGIVPQEPVVLSASLAANITLGSDDAEIEAIERAAKTAQLHDVLRKLPAGLCTRIGEQGVRLSGGERQRVAIARLLFRQPDICVLDEATSMLDGRTEAVVLAGLREALHSRTIIAIAHRLTSIVGFDQILVLDLGRIVEQGTHRELLSAGGLYSTLWRSQVTAAIQAESIDPERSTPG